MELANTGGYATADGSEQPLGLALLPGVSLAADLSVGIVESAVVGNGADTLSWHVDRIRQRQRDVDAAEAEVRARVAAIIAAADSGAGAPDPAPSADVPLAFGPTRRDAAARSYRETPAPPPEPTDREGRPRKRRSRWETTAGNDDNTTTGSALALVQGAPPRLSRRTSPASPRGSPAREAARETWADPTASARWTARAPRIATIRRWCVSTRDTST